MADSQLSSKKLVTLLWPFVREDAALLGMGGAALLVSSVSNALAPQILRMVIDGSPGRPTLTKAAAVFAIGAVASYIRTRAFGVVSARLGMRLRVQLFKSLVKQEMTFFDSEKTAAVVDALLQDVDTCTKTMISSGTNVLRYSSSLTCGTVMIMQIASKATQSWRATLKFSGMTLTVVPVVAVMGLRQWKRLRGERSKDDLLRVDTKGFVFERISSIKTVRSFAREAFEADRFSEVAKEASATAGRVAGAEAALMGTLDLTIKSTAVGLVGYGSSLVRSGELSAGSLTSFTFYAGLVGMGLAGLSRVSAADWQNPARRILRYLERTPELPLEGGESKARLLGAVRFEAVEFEYPGRGSEGKPLLHGVDLELRSGEVVALTGPSGCGKTTIGRLLLQLYKPSRGQIYFDGAPADSFDPSWLRSQIGVVEQEATLWSGTVRENIRYGRLDADDAAVEAAARLANAHDFIMALANGYETQVGERGLQLSGGQRQRVAIARALVREPPLLLLDEATAALDAEAEAVVHAALRQAMKGRTVLVIAHNEANFSFADRLEVLSSVSEGCPSFKLSTASP